jgi:hypothetical protein
MSKKPHDNDRHLLFNIILLVLKPKRRKSNFQCLTCKLIEECSVSLLLVIAFYGE